MQKSDLDEFLNRKEDAYAIFQMTSSADNAKQMFMPLDYLTREGAVPERKKYELCYQEEIGGEVADMSTFLEDLFVRFNINIPDGYHGRSMSVSDVVAVKRNGKTQFFNVDSVGFKEIDF